jgi:hypothetical protein
MNTPKTLFAAAALALATALPAYAQSGGNVLIKEGFDDISALAKWQLINASEPAGQSWFQGNPGVFPAFEGPPESYIGANYLSALNGSGAISNWLITPLLNMTGPTTLTFFTRGATAAGFNDTLEVRFSSDPSGAPGTFGTTLLTIGGAEQYPGDWQQYTAVVPYTGAGYFAFHYLGDASAANYIGVDSVLVMSVPEPSSWLMLALGLAGASLAARRQAQKRLMGGSNHA